MIHNSINMPRKINLTKLMIKNVRHEDGGIHLIPSRWYLILLMALLFTADFLVIYAGIEEMMYESMITCFAFAAVISVVFIASPSMIVSTLLVKDRNRIHTISAAMLSLILIVMFIFWGVWRMQSQTTVYDSSVLTTQTGNLSSARAALENTADNIRNAERSFKGLLIAVPVGNSLLYMLITLLDATAVSRAKRKVRKYAVKLQEYIEQQEAVVQELEEALKQDLYKEYAELYNEAVKAVNAREDMVKMEVRRIIAEYLADPDLAADLFKETLTTIIETKNKSPMGD